MISIKITGLSAQTAWLEPKRHFTYLMLATQMLPQGKPERETISNWSRLHYPSQDKCTKSGAQSKINRIWTMLTGLTLNKFMTFLIDCVPLKATLRLLNTDETTFFLSAPVNFSLSNKQSDCLCKLQLTYITYERFHHYRFSTYAHTVGRYQHTPLEMERKVIAKYASMEIESQ